MTGGGTGPGLRLGLRLPQYAASWPELRDAAIRAESLGFDSVWLNDHLQHPGRVKDEATFDAFTALAAIAAVTRRVRLGTAVLSASYRPAPLAAKMATLLDVISAGRLVLGLGTGSDRPEHAAYGYPFGGPRERTAALRQALDVVEAMFAHPDGATVDGVIANAPNQPAPVQRPRPPVLLAAHRPGLLKLAGTRADGMIAAFPDADDLAARVAIADQARRDAGRDTPLQVAVYLYAMPVRSHDEAREWLAPEAQALGTHPDALLRWLPTRGLVGAPEEIAEALRGFAAAGATDAVLVLPNRMPPEAIDALAQIMGSGTRGRGVTPSSTSRDNLVDLLVERHRRDGHGADPAVTDEAGTWDYAALGAALRRAAGALGAAGLRPGERVAVVMRDGRPWVQAVLGTAAAGGVAVPLDPGMDPDSLGGVLDDAAAAIVVADQPVPPGPWRVIAPGQLDDAMPARIASVHPEDPAYIVFSSGSTGRPKGAVHAHRDMRVSVEGYSREVLGLGPGDTCHAVPRGYTSLGFGNGFYRPLGRGAHVVATGTRPNVRTVLHATSAHGVTVLTAVPTFWSQLAEFLSRHPDQAEALTTVRLGVSSGDRLPAAVMARMRQVAPGLEIVEGLGCSECSNIVISTRPGDDLPGQLGRAVSGAEVSLRDDAGHEVSGGTPGRLWIRSESNTSGYVRRGDLTRDLLIGEWIRMGDMLVQEDGIYRHLGRADDLFKVDARWVSPTEVENALLEHPSVGEVAVVGRPDEHGLMRVVAMVVGTGGHDIEKVAKDLRAHVAARIGPHAAPVHVEWREDLPHLPSGKVARRALREPEGR